MVDLGGYVIILVETKEKKVKLYGESKDICHLSPCRCNCDSFFFIPCVVAQDEKKSLLHRKKWTGRGGRAS